MNLSDTRTRVTELLAFDLDNFKADANGTVTNASLNAQINWAQRLLSKKLFLYDPSITLTLANNQQSYDLRNVSTSSFSRKVLWVHYVIIGGVTLKDNQGTEPGLFSMEEFQKNVDGWRTAANGTPTAAMQADRYLYLYPKPNGSGSNNYVAGRYMAADLANDSDIPDIPEELHDILAALAAVRAAEPSVSEQEGWARIQRYDASMPEQVAMAFEQSYQSVFGSMKGIERFVPRTLSA